MMICNDRRWPETYRVMGLQGVELILCGYNTPIHYAPDPSQDILQGFHNALVMQSGAYQNGTWVVAAAKAGIEAFATVSSPPERPNPGKSTAMGRRPAPARPSSTGCHTRLQ